MKAGKPVLNLKDRWVIKNWTTLDGRTIPVKYMTTTHLANAMYHCDKNAEKIPAMSLYKEGLLVEWDKRQKEGIWPKAKRFMGRVLGRYYTKKIENTPKKTFAPDHSILSFDDLSDFH